MSTDENLLTEIMRSSNQDAVKVFDLNILPECFMGANAICPVRVFLCDCKGRFHFIVE